MHRNRSPNAICSGPYYPDVIELASDLVRRRAFIIDELLLDPRHAVFLRRIGMRYYPNNGALGSLNDYEKRVGRQCTRSNSVPSARSTAA